MRHDLLDCAYDDEGLSVVGLGLIVRLIHMADDDDRVPPQTEIRVLLRMGPRPLKAACDELYDRGYLVRIARRFGTAVFLAPRPGPQPVRTAKWRVAKTSTHISTSTSSTNTLERDRTKTSSVPLPGEATASPGRGTPNIDKIEVQMDHELWGHTPADTSDEGAVGRMPETVQERQKRRMSTEAITLTTRPSPGTGRSAKSVETWNAVDLVAEFIDRTRAATPSVDQVNARALGGRIASWRRAGRSSADIHEAIDRFFADKRNLNDVGKGAPLWVRFAVYYRDTQTMIARATGSEPDPMRVFMDQINTKGALLGKPLRF